ncbi:hypothetical protein BE20_20305 [Sorangium cellulosum]|nr:hypothetical protein BE20_20305 [Sorangium cellulosum]
MSSTTRIRRASVPETGPAAPSASAGGSTAGRRTVNSLPRPSPSLAAATEPLCISTSRFTSVSPMPRPPRARPSVGCACSKRSKMRGSISSGMPYPVSFTRTTISDPSWRAESQIRPPSRVYFAAFVSRLTITCSRRAVSPNTGSGRGPTSSASSCFEASISGAAAATAW